MVLSELTNGKGNVICLENVSSGGGRSGRCFLAALPSTTAINKPRAARVHSQKSHSQSLQGRRMICVQQSPINSCSCFSEDSSCFKRKYVEQSPRDCSGTRVRSQHVEQADSRSYWRSGSNFQVIVHLERCLPFLCNESRLNMTEML